jgi:hypothetical protein
MSVPAMAEREMMLNTAMASSRAPAPRVPRLRVTTTISRKPVMP